MSQHKRRTFQKRHPSQRTPSAPGKKVKSLKDKLQEMYSAVDLRTACSGHCVCCNVACPQMSYSEFLVIVDELYRREKRSDRVEVLKASIRYFFSNSLVKPCPLLVDKRCSCYDVRPLPCRLYGLWPEDMYEDRVLRFMINTGLKKSEIPLNTQCKFVTRIDPTQPITREVIESMFRQLDVLDMGVGGFNEPQIKKRYNQRTWHDWYMVTVFGEERLSALSSYFLAAPEDAVKDLAEKMCVEVDKLGDDMFAKLEREVGDGDVRPHSYR